MGNAKKPRKGDATAEEMSKAVQLAGTKVMAPKAVTKRPRAMAITADMQAFKTIRQARAFKRLHSIRAKKAADAEADELSKKKEFVAGLESAEIHLANISLKKE